MRDLSVYDSMTREELVGCIVDALDDAGSRPNITRDEYAEMQAELGRLQEALRGCAQKRTRLKLKRGEE